MTISKQLLGMDQECCDILKDETNKSEYARKAIKFFNNSKKKIKTVELTQPIITELN